MEEEYFFLCPYCWQEISMLLDLTERRAQYVEDCEICCNPIEIRYKVEDHQYVTEFDAKRIDE
ncbi:MAG: CPXCG motif-containing cysteine-rich protein [bacterium]|nr:CPXCG motif-containing cysteine-rich protein [bacterium]